MLLNEQLASLVEALVEEVNKKLGKMPVVFCRRLRRAGIGLVERLEVSCR